MGDNGLGQVVSVVLSALWISHSSFSGRYRGTYVL